MIKWFGPAFKKKHLKKHLKKGTEKPEYHFHIGRDSVKALSKFSSSYRDPKEEGGRSGDVLL